MRSTTLCYTGVLLIVGGSLLSHWALSGRPELPIQISPSHPVNLGDVALDSSPTTVFTIKNSTWTTIDVLSVEKSCSCSFAESSTQNINPGRSSTVTLFAKSSNRPGPMTISAEIIYQFEGSSESRSAIASAFANRSSNLSVK